ncbi:hypothetical protein BGX38DRAFT_906105 [Terfezia claveryi]|nr:hypothetical protein BGX38DRAFT_906105 [Terfezia claveryi]
MALLATGQSRHAAPPLVIAVRSRPAHTPADISHATIGPTLLSFHHRRPLRGRGNHSVCTTPNASEISPEPDAGNIAPTLTIPSYNPITPPCHAPTTDSPFNNGCNDISDVQRNWITPPLPDALLLSPLLTLERRHPSDSLLCPLPPVPSLHSLTFSSLERISRSLNSPVFIHCPPSVFWEWRYQNSGWLSEASSRWEYDTKNHFFIIKCMASPIHEAFTGYATSLILHEIQRFGNLRPGSNLVSLHANTDVTNFTGHRRSKRVADLSIEVRLHPPSPVVYRRGIIVEVGFAQPLPSLMERAEMWLLDKSDEVHMVILLHIPERIPKHYGILSRAEANKKKTKWQRGWFEGRDFEDEYIWRKGNLDCSGSDHERILDEIEGELAQKLLEQDSIGVLIPPLFHPLDGEMYVYERKSDKDKSSNTLPAAVMNQAKRKRSDTPDDQSIWEFPVSSPSGEDSSSTSDYGDPRSDSTPSRGHLLKCTWQTTFLKNGVYTPLSSSSTHELRLPIASLYGVLPTSTAANTEAAIPPEILALIPPAIRPHAHREIFFAMDDIANLFTDEVVILKMREQRAVNRAGGVIQRCFRHGGKN